MKFQQQCLWLVSRSCWKGNKGKKSARYFAMNCVRAHLPATCIENLLEEKEKKSLDSRTKNQVVSWQSSPEVYPKEEKGQMYSFYYLTLPIKSCKDDGSVLKVFSATAKSKFLREKKQSISMTCVINYFWKWGTFI